jgi:hypothetical protein
MFHSIKSRIITQSFCLISFAALAICVVSLVGQVGEIFVEALHQYGNQKNPDFPIDRDAFDIDRKQYWQDRAAEANASKNGGRDL